MYKDALQFGGPDARVLAMLMSWMTIWYGVYRRDLKGSLTAMTGVGVTLCALAGAMRSVEV